MQTTTLRKGIVIIIISILFTSSTITLGQLNHPTLTPLNQRTILYVGGTGPYNFTTIQSAIDYANTDDTIFVYNGTYYENISIDKSLDLIGENKNTSIINETGNNHVITITAENVSINQFTIKGANDSGFTAGISLQSNNCTITQNIIELNTDGIRIINSDHNLLTYNIIQNNSDEGILIDHSTNNTITNNVIINNGHTSAGIWLEYASDNTIHNNILSNNTPRGIFLLNSDNNTITQCMLLNHTNGINTNGALSNSNIIYHNSFINNTNTANDGHTNTWNDTYPSGGNYWDDYTGSDTNDDGIGDTPYTIPGGINQDYYPLMNIYGTPMAAFTYTINLLTVTFDASTSYDPDGTITNYTWEFGDNTTDTGQTTQHTYAHTGYFQVNLTITDNDLLTDNTTHTFLLNTPPYTPSNPDPPNATTGHCSVLLNWTGGDPNPSNTITYDVYFGPATTPPKISSNQSITSYDPGSLPASTIYYWYIVAWDNHNASSTGPLWHFRTNCPPSQPTDPHPEHGATDVSINTILTWTGIDPDLTQPLSYDVYFGTTTPPPKVSNNQTTTTYTPSTLTFDTAYYWQITTWDPCNTSTTAPVWEFTTAPYYRVPDLDCVGSLSWAKVPPGSIQHGAFTIINIGEASSKLNWQIASTPTWGTWNLTPNSGYALTPQAGPVVITVEVTAPNIPQSDFTGNIKVINTDDPTDYELIPVTLTTPNSFILTFLHQLIERFPLLQPLLSTIIYFLFL